MFIKEFEFKVIYFIFTGMIGLPAIYFFFVSIYDLLLLHFDENERLYDQIQVTKSDDEFKKDLSQYYNLKKNYDEFDLKKSNLKSEIENYKKKYLRKRYHDCLSVNRISVRSKNSTKKGKSEITFLNYLLEFFTKNEIMIDVELGAYYPDFVYTSDKYNFCIDIEIDEKFESKTKSPIHYIGSDNKRNEYFLSQNWFIIRFTETQIIKQPLICIAYLNDVIKKIENPEKLISLNYKNFNENCWSYEEVILEINAKKTIKKQAPSP